MNRFAIKFTIVLVLLIQAGWLLLLLPSLNELNDHYRYDERQTALVLWMNDKTPESKAVFDNERHLLSDHLRTKKILIISTCLIVDVIGIYYSRNYSLKKQDAS